MTGHDTAIRLLSLRWLGRERVRGYALILFLASLISLGWFYQQAMGPAGSDFLAFWSAGRLVVQGMAASAYDLAATQAVQAEVGRTDVFAFVNPPPFLFIVAPFGLLPYPLAWIAWIGATFGAWFLASRRLAPELSWPIAAFPGALVAAWHAQTGFIVSALHAAAAGLLRSRPFVAGLFVGALIVKPHLALLFPVAFAAGRQWRAFAGAAVGALGLLLLAWTVFGTQTMLDYRQSWDVSRVLMETSDAVFFLRQVTIYAAFRAAGAPMAAIGTQILAALLAATLVWRGWRGTGPLDGKIALLMAATPFATPYLFSYDLPFLIIPTCWLVRRAIVQPVGAWERPLLLALYVAPLAARAFALPLGVNLMPFASAAMLWLCWMRLRQSETALTC